MKRFGRTFSAMVLALAAGFLLRPVRLVAWDYPVVPAPALTPVRTPGLYLEPFQDTRRIRDLWRGQTRFDRVGIEATGLGSQVPAWRTDAYGSASFLWERELARALAAAGLTVVEADPLDPGRAAAAERSSRARGVLGGRIIRLVVEKRGSDSLFGTDFNGDDYVFILRLRLKLRALASGFKAASQTWEFSHTFHDPTRLGSQPKDTFPVYFARGLSLAAASLASSLIGFEGMAPAPGGNSVSYWINPKTRRRMDPSWNFDPSDGTPRSRFVHVRGPAGVPVGATVPLVRERP